MSSPSSAPDYPRISQPAQFTEFELGMDIGKQIDERIARGADIVDTLTDLGVPERDAEIMELARTGNRITVELTAHDSTNGARHQTDVSVNLISTEVGLDPRQSAGGGATRGRNVNLRPAEPFAVSMAVRDLTARLPSGTWFPNENYDICQH